MLFREITLSDISELSVLFMETFNSPPWNDGWTIETSSKRLHQMMNCEDAYGIMAYQDEELCGMILGSEEQFFDGVTFNIKEFCVKNELRNRGIGTIILDEFEIRLKSRGTNSIFLLTSRDNGTEEFYKKRGLETYNSMVIMGKQL